MPRLSGLEALRRLKAAFPELAVLVLTMHASEPYLFQVIQAGGAGYVLKQTADEHLLGAIRDAARGTPFLYPTMEARLLTDYVHRARRAGERAARGYLALTEREREVLSLVAQGHTNQEIADRLIVSVKTVETHRAHLMTSWACRPAPSWCSTPCGRATSPPRRARGSEAGSGRPLGGPRGYSGARRRSASQAAAPAPRPPAPPVSASGRPTSAGRSPGARSGWPAAGRARRAPSPPRRAPAPRLPGPTAPSQTARATRTAAACCGGPSCRRRRKARKTGIGSAAGGVAPLRVCHAGGASGPGRSGQQHRRQQGADGGTPRDRPRAALQGFPRCGARGVVAHSPETRGAPPAAPRQGGEPDGVRGLPRPGRREPGDDHPERGGGLRRLRPARHPLHGLDAGPLHGGPAPLPRRGPDGSGDRLGAGGGPAAPGGERPEVRRPGAPPPRPRRGQGAARRTRA